jgi:uncharacterized membrane protein YidH (DUF202 family)
MVKRLLSRGRDIIRRRKKLNYRKEKILLLREQTILAKERTVLSFIRTGLASIGAGIIIINIFSSDSSSLAIGWAFILTGVVEIFESYRRLRVYKSEMKKINVQLGE